MSTVIAAPDPRRIDRSGRWVAAPAALSAALHLVMLLSGAHDGWIGAAMLLMTIGCTWCAVELAWRPSRHGLRMLLVMANLMAVVHLFAIIGLPGLASTPGHAHHFAAAPTMPGVPVDDGGMLAGMLAITVIELLVAFAAAVALRRHGGVDAGRRADLERRGTGQERRWAS